LNNTNRSVAALLAIVCLGAAPWVQAQILPANRTADWSVSGVPGGIPNRTTVCASLAAGATQAQIQSALNACPANQVVQLAAGTYSILIFTLFTTTSSPFALSLSKGFYRGTRWLRQAQPERCGVSRFM
jgi:hypothetical protein